MAEGGDPEEDINNLFISTWKDTLTTCLSMYLEGDLPTALFLMEVHYNFQRTTKLKSFYAKFRRICARSVETTGPRRDSIGSHRNQLLYDTERLSVEDRLELARAFLHDLQEASVARRQQGDQDLADAADRIANLLITKYPGLDDRR